MLTRTKFALAALLLAGSAGGAMAQAPYGDNRPASVRTYGPGFGAYAYAPPRPAARRAAVRRAINGYAYAPGPMLGPAAWGAYAYAPGPMVAPGAWGAYASSSPRVYEAGKLIGQDPDPNVRLMLAKDFAHQ